MAEGGGAGTSDAGGGGRGAGGGGGGAGLLVQVPGRVEDAAAALEALGGARAVAAAAATGADLWLRLRPERGAPKLRGVPRPTCGLFLQVSRAPNGALSGQVAGRFSSAYSFEDMADYAFDSESRGSEGRGSASGREGGAEEGAAGEPAPPPTFSRATAPSTAIAEAEPGRPRWGEGKRLQGLSGRGKARGRDAGGGG